LLLAAGAGLSLLGFAPAALPQNAAHPNTLTIVHEDDKNLVFQFSLNVPQVLHQLLAPATPFPAFLQAHAAMSPVTWDAVLQKAKAQLSAIGVLTLPGGKPLRLQSWQWPDSEGIAQSLKAQALMLQMPEASRPHLDPVPVLARLQTQKSIYQAQLQLPTALHPIEVSIKNDKFWLTSQIPLAMVNLQ
jgi:hypothetical protein